MVRCAGESISDIGRDVTSCGAGGGNWFSQTTTYFYGGDAAKSGAIANNGQSWMQTTVQGEGIISFYWKVSSQNGPDFLEFVVDGVRQASISGVSEWQKKVISITGSGTHTLQWQYTKDGSDSYYSDCGWVDYVQWPTMLTGWDTVSYTYDPGGRRIAKAYDGHVVMKYLYDGDHIIAEYDATGALVHKYIYGPGVDQPICMIDVADANATYYYHFDGLGSVIALTDGSGDAVQLYEYSIFGEVSASDPNHPNRFLFTGREFDSETGLYYYRARYYNPYIGRFLQTDPVGYAAGINLYRYCGNNPARFTDPLGLIEIEQGTHEAPGFCFWQGGDPLSPSFHAIAEQFDMLAEIKNPSDVFTILTALKESGQTFSDYYFDGHTGGNYGPDDAPTKLRMGGPEGDANIPIYDAEYDWWWRELGELLPSDATIHFRSCSVANGLSTLRRLAKLTGHPVTGCTGNTEAAGKAVKNGPDTIFYGDIYKANPDGTTECLWRRYKKWSEVVTDATGVSRRIFHKDPNPVPPPY